MLRQKRGGRKPAALMLNEREASQQTYGNSYSARLLGFFATLRMSARRAAVRFPASFVPLLRRG